MADEGFFNLLPDSNIIDEKDTLKSKTYCFDMDKNRIIGKLDDKEAIIQAIMLRLMTDVKVYQIFSNSYGLAVNDLMGLPSIIVQLELERRITETLLCDERINSITAFTLTPCDDGVVTVNFVANTIYGDVQVERGYDV